MQELVGVGQHNANLVVSSRRVLEGGSWKQQRIVVVIPAAAMISAKVALAHASLVFPPNQAVYRLLALGYEVGDAYSTAIDQILQTPGMQDWEYVLTVEHDNLPPPFGVLQLIAQLDAHPELAAVSGLYWTKGEGGVPQIWGAAGDPSVNYRPQVPVPGALVECCGIGMGFALWRLSMFKDDRIERPWFKTLAGPGGVGTQDLAFWTKARRAGYRCAVDCSVLVGHLDVGTGMIW